MSGDAGPSVGVVASLGADTQSGQINFTLPSGITLFVVCGVRLETSGLGSRVCFWRGGGRTFTGVVGYERSNRDRYI